jgi:hypothetical protein
MSESAYLVSLNTVEQLAVDAVADDAAVWITQLVQKNCQILIDQLVHDTVDRCLARDLPIPPTREEIIKLSVTRGWAKILPV